MIIKTEETIEPFPSNDPPPTYTARDGDSDEELTTPVAPTTNFFSLHSSSRIKGTYVIDPLLIIPEAFLPALHRGETEQTRPNIRLVASHGAIDAEIHITGDHEENNRIRLEKPPLDESGKRRKTLIKLHTKNGTVCTNINAAVLPRGPLNIDVSTSHGNVLVRLPRSYHGPLTMSTRHGTIHLSHELSSSSITLADVRGTRTCFVGDFSQWTAGGGSHLGPDGSGWAGDVAHASTKYGSVKVMYVDDRELRGAEAKEAGSLGFGSWDSADDARGCACCIQ